MRRAIAAFLFGVLFTLLAGAAVGVPAQERCLYTGFLDHTDAISALRQVEFGWTVSGVYRTSASDGPYFLCLRRPLISLPH
jgi:hypothetical protein